MFQRTQIMSEDACTMFISDRNPIEILSQCTILSECMLSYLIELWDHDKSCHLKNVYCDLPYQKAQQIAQEQVHQLAIPEVPWSTMNYVNCGVCNRLYDSGNLALEKVIDLLLFTQAESVSFWKKEKKMNEIR